jgi:hypothetical protein
MTHDPQSEPEWVDTTTPPDALASPDASPAPNLPPAAVRALAEAALRHAQQSQVFPTELGGRNGPEPVRFGDWEKKGIAIDF